ncbi:gonadotropin-releasing hormone II receptor-like [Panulirus ornatus]|uniref:gonadotropin-releasing hormone II receptor-like n=1 Tax=Panulirus ornatus TaxID=150431 RepID=UPI003A855AD8
MTSARMTSPSALVTLTTTGEEEEEMLLLLNATGDEVFTTLNPLIPQGATIIHNREVWTASAIQRVATLAVLMVLSLAGNVMVIVVLGCSSLRCPTSRVNIFIINLAIGDLAVCLITMSGEILFEVFGEWVLGAAACKLLVYSEIVTLSSTTFLLMVMSWDRYQAICRPLDFTSSGRRARWLIGLAWLAAFLMAIPHLFIFVQVQEGYHPDGSAVYACQSRGYSHEWQRKAMFTWLTFYILLLPSVLITFCYVSIVRVVFRQSATEQRLQMADGYTVLRKTTPSSKSLSRAKIKTVKMTFSIILTFVACWTPYFLVHNIRIWSDYQYDIPQPVIVFSETIALVNSVINPVLYGCFNLRFKQRLKDVCWKTNPGQANMYVNSTYHYSASRRGSSALVHYSSSRSRVTLSMPQLRLHASPVHRGPRSSSQRHQPPATSASLSTATTSTSCLSLTKDRVVGPARHDDACERSARPRHQYPASLSCHHHHAASTPALY